MIYASKKSELVKAGPKRNAFCPVCNQPVFSIHHNDVWSWSHLNKIHCDTWADDETVWSSLWKNQFDPECVDIPIKGNASSHLADIYTHSKVSIRLSPTLFQKEPISKIELFFGERLIWIIDARSEQIEIENSNDETLSIELPKIFEVTKWHESNSPLFFDINQTDLLYFESGAHIEMGLGKIIPKERFLKKYSS